MTNEHLSLKLEYLLLVLNVSIMFIFVYSVEGNLISKLIRYVVTPNFLQEEKRILPLFYGIFTSKNNP